MVLALPHLDGEAAPTLQPSQDNELQKQYLELLQMKIELEESCKKKDELLRDTQRALAEEQAKRETAEREKQLLEERCKEMQQKIKLLEIMFNKSIIQLKEEMKIETENLLRKQDEKIQRLEAQIEVLTEKKKNNKNDCTSETTASDKEENSSEHSWWSKICDIIKELTLLLTKFFSSG
ncbi:guanylate-binding protein 6-like [Meles meles]|uniref:guanylate-binding protein 6-like n=1 Tax=Meles meles TaxID=9662 RepID=UPI001E698A80|nr:guanylate-binding protein 6-like [Meles meles]XP_045872494.1 guanylate-binding protein 6-like [Meles meles]